MTTSERPTTAQVMMAFAELLATRSTCERAAVGAVVTDASMLQVLGIGYNGNARGAHNGCDDYRAVGACGCLHAEINAMLKAPGVERGKLLFCTHSPCWMCAKAIINAGVSFVYYRRQRPDAHASIALLQQSDVGVLQLDPAPNDLPTGSPS